MPGTCRSQRRQRILRSMTVASPAQTLSATGARDHIVDVLIAERAPKLAATPAWPLLRPLLYAMLDHRKAVRMAGAIAALPGGAALDHVSRLLELKVVAHGLQHLPASGRAIV